MVNFKYNIINLLKVILSALNMILMLRLFGISQGSDIYLLAYSILMSWHYIPLLFIGQFIQFYNDLKIESVDIAHRFYNQSLLFSLLVGFLLFLVCCLFIKPIVSFYTINLDADRFNLLIKLLKIMIFSNLLAPLVTLTEQLFVAEKYFLQSYLLHLIILAGPVLAMTYMLFSHTANINILALSYAISVTISGIFGVIVAAKKIIPFEFVFKTKNFKNFISNSFSTYSGNAIYNSLFPVVLNNFLVNFSNGIISCFYYSKNAIEATSMIANDYSNKELLSELSILTSNKDTVKIKDTIKKYLVIAPVLFLVCSLLIYFSIPLILKIIFFKSTILLDGKLLANIFIALAFWTIAFVITNPFYYFNVLSKKSYIIILTHSIFVGLIALYFKYCAKNIFNVPVAMFLAQIIILIIHIYFTQKIMKKYEIKKTKENFNAKS